MEVSQPILGLGFVSVTAPCPDGTMPVGGGASMDGQVEFALLASTTFPAAPLGWVAAAQITGDPQEGTEFTVVAVRMEAEVI